MKAKSDGNDRQLSAWCLW